MGSPISYSLAMLVLDHLLNNVIPILNFDLLYIFKSVGDIICSIPFNTCQTNLELIDLFNRHIQFTIEEENQRSVPFLDIKSSELVKIELFHLRLVSETTDTRKTFDLLIENTTKIRNLILS